MEGKTIYLTRHGVTDDNLKHIYQGVSQDNGLNEKGREQALLLGKWLKKYYPLPDVVLTSPAKRALDTACAIHFEIFGKEKKHNFFSVPLLHEINHGDWEGKSDSEVALAYPYLYNLWHNNPMDMAFPNGETMEEARARILKVWVHDILNREEKIILIVAHGGVNFQIINHSIGSSRLRNVWQDNTCLNIIELNDKNKLRVKLINSTAHLLTPLEALQ